jgi:hypothetical protein
MIPETLTRLALLFFFVGIVSLAHWLVMFLFCICGGFKVQDVKLFAGKTIFTCSIANIPVSVGWIPSGASVQTDPDQARTRPFYLRLLMPTVGVGAILALAVCVLGFHAANSAFWATYVQLIRGVVAPLAYGREHINSFLIVAQNSPVYGFGIVAAKCGARSAICGMRTAPA